MYGAYTARLYEKDCNIYGEQNLFSALFLAVKNNRCLNKLEWDEFCAYLDKHQEISAMLIFPDLWTAIQAKECNAELESRLGPVIDETVVDVQANRGKGEETPSRIRKYSPYCRSH